MSLLNRDLLDRWTRPGPRLPDIEGWLLDTVWTENRFQACGNSPSAYLKSGERLVNEREVLLTATAGSIFDELIAGRNTGLTVAEFFSQNGAGAAVIFDGCSLREIPRLVELARASKRPVLSLVCSRSAFPSTTEHFIGDRLGLGLPTIAPSKMASRGELRERGVTFYYFQEPNDMQSVSDNCGLCILWSRFPDVRYTDSTARSAEMYDGIWDLLGLAWKNTVQALPRNCTVVVTSDHGYVFLDAGLSDQSLEGKDRVFRGKRFRRFEDNEPLPENDPYIWLDRKRRLGAIKGRCHNRPQAPSASQSIYRHGGISLMEVLTPWLVLGPMEE